MVACVPDAIGRSTSGFCVKPERKLRCLKWPPSILSVPVFLTCPLDSKFIIQCERFMAPLLQSEGRSSRGNEEEDDPSGAEYSSRSGNQRTTSEAEVWITF